MRYYTGSGFRLARLPHGLRLILTLYLLITLLGFWVAGGKYVVRGLLGPDGIAKYYLGEATGGDALLTGSTTKGVGFLIDVTHPHLFTVPLVLLVLCHLVQLCERSQRLKNVLYLMSFGGLFLTFGLPWVMRFAPWAGIGISIGGSALLLSGSIMCVLPLRDLWRRLPAKDKTRADG